MLKMKRILFVILAGLLNAVIPVLLLGISDNDIRFLFGSAFVLTFFTGIYIRISPLNRVLSTTISILPFLVLFSFVVLSEVPNLGVYLLPWTGSFLLGFFLPVFSQRIFRIGFVILFIAGAYLCNSMLVPYTLREILSQKANEPAPQIILETLEGKEIKLSETKGKIIVMDFFGTWCAPCIKELPKLEEVKRNLENENIIFMVVCNDQPGDSPDKVKKFIEKYKFSFDFYYDHKGQAEKLLNLQGVPSMAIIDRQGKIRWRKMGYNDGESDFVPFLTHLLKDLNRQ